MHILDSTSLLPVWAHGWVDLSWGYFLRLCAKALAGHLTLGCAMYLHLRELGLAWLFYCSPMKVLLLGLSFVSADSILSF